MLDSVGHATHFSASRHGATILILELLPSSTLIPLGMLTGCWVIRLECPALELKNVGSIQYRYDCCRYFYTVVCDVLYYQNFQTVPYNGNKYFDFKHRYPYPLFHGKNHLARVPGLNYSVLKAIIKVIYVNRSFHVPVLSKFLFVNLMSARWD